MEEQIGSWTGAHTPSVNREDNADIAQPTQLKRYYGIDLFKFICSFLIVAGHVAPLSTYSELLNYGVQKYLAKVTVPFYFIASGYLLFPKLGGASFNAKVPRRYVGKILKLYLIWTLIYFPFILHDRILSHPKGFVYGALSWVKSFLFTGSYVQLWYLNATIVATIIVCFLLYKGVKLEHLLMIASVLYLIGLLPQSYFGLLRPLRPLYPALWRFLKALQKVIGTTRNGIFEGFLFIGLGMLVAYKQVAMSVRKATLCFALSMLAFLAEFVLLASHGWIRAHDMYVFMVPSAFFLFILSVAIPLKPSANYNYLREVGTLMFYLHMLVDVITKKLYFLLMGYELKNSLLRYGSVVLVTWGASHLIIAVSHREQFRWLQKLYK